MSEFIWWGERLWLDAVNSEFISEGRRIDGWGDVAALERWFREAAGRHSEAGALLDFAVGNRGEELVAKAKRLRSLLRRTCEIAHGSASPQVISHETVEAVNTALQQGGVVLQLERGEESWHEREQWDGNPESALWILARSAARSWMRGELVRVKPCGNPDCILWFMDVSKNGQRRWCSMEGCGNRHKVTAYHQRRKKVQASQV